MSAALYLHVVSLEARKQMSYRVDFWLKTVTGFLAEFGVLYCVTWALFAESGATEIRGYTCPEMILYFVTAMLMSRLVRGPDFGETVSEDIYQGGLTRYLLFPRSYLGMKYAQHLGELLPVTIQVLLFGLVAALLLDAPRGTGVTPLGVAAALVSMMVGNLLYFLMRLPIQMVAFWQDNVWSLILLLANVARLLGGGMLPLALFPERARAILWWLPFRHLYDVPVRTLLGQVGPWEWATSLGLGVAWCLVAGLVARAVWRRGARTYTGVGI